MNNELTQEELDNLLKGCSEDRPGIEQFITGEVLSAKCFSICISSTTIGIGQADKVFNSIRKMVVEFDYNIIINLRNCQFFSSFAIGEIAQLAVDRKKRNVRIAIVEANQIILDVLSLTSINEIIEIYKTTEEALSAFSDGEKTSEE